MKTCKICLAPDHEFYASNKSVCKDCLKARSKKWAESNREKYLEYQSKYHKTEGRQHRAKRFEWLDEIKNAPCADCNNSFPPECMDFDHIDPTTKKFAVSYAAVAGYSVELVKAEIEKCRLICANCHRIRTAKQQGRRSTSSI